MSIQFYIYACYKYRALISADLFDYNFGFLSRFFHFVFVVVVACLLCVSPWRIFINLLQPRATDFTLIQFICRYTATTTSRERECDKIVVITIIISSNDSWCTAIYPGIDESSSYEVIEKLFYLKSHQTIICIKLYHYSIYFISKL